ncbi:MAG TPA: hypothetical protein VD902_01465 [Symbiobacteriaceae bacterium]|nr:hypothetical protein [Symbiobacteriaceae bacterium]
MNPALRTALYLWKSAVIGLLLGLDTAWLLTKFRWIDMRLPTGKVIPWFVVAALALGVHTATRPYRLRHRLGAPGLLSSRMLGWLVLILQPVAAAAFTGGDWSALLIVPAALVRDTLPVSPTLSHINPWLLGLLAFGLPALLFDPEKHCPHPFDIGGTCK